MTATRQPVGRCAALACLIITILGMPTTPAASREAAAPVDPYGPVWNVLPPGQSGTIDAVELATVLAGSPDRVAVDGRNAPPNFADQLEMYDRLGRKAPGSLRASDLGSLFKRESFTPSRVLREERPKAGVRIRWDEFGVPYVNGDSFGAVAYGAGYAGTLDRMFLMDVLRNAGRATLASFAGATPANVAMDQEQLRQGFYTEREASAQVEKAARRYGAEGRRLVAALDQFLAGINAAQAKLCPLGLPTGAACPVEYAALQKTPRPCTRADVVYVASLVGGIFGKGGGGEYANAIWAQRLISKFGRTTGLRIYRDLREKNDPDAPTTATTYTPYGGGDRLRPGKPGVALPDVGGRTAPGTGAPLAGTDAPVPGLPGLPLDLPTMRIDLPNGPIELPLKGGGTSNALLVGGKHTRSGKPIAVMGPQTGYFAPQLWTEQVLVGPGIRSRGVAFAGTNLVVQIGRGTDYAWSATSAGNDNVDTVVERLCSLDQSRASVRSTGYRVNGRCRPMQRHTHSCTALPSAASPEPPKTYRYLVLRTHHGIVQTRTTVRGKPVAIVLQRSTYRHEVDSVVGFARWNNPNVVHDVHSFQRAAKALDFTFNWFYADNRDIGYVSSGLLPVRSPDVDYDLPRWGDRRYDWQGWLPNRSHVRQVNPGRGYLISWNNKTAPGFSAADNEWGYGAVYRSFALERRLRSAVAGGRRVGVPEVVGVMSGGATEDTRAKYTVPFLLRVIGNDPSTRAARTALRAWVGAGAPRVDRDRDGHYAHEEAIAIFDAWWDDGRNSVAYTVLGGRLGSLVHKLPQRLDDHPRQGSGSAWNGVAWYGYVNKDLRQVLRLRTERPYSVSYCGRGVLRTCRASLRTSLRVAVARLLARQGVESVWKLTYDKHQDDIRSSVAGVVGVRPMDWQNRPTFQQVVAFTGHRRR